MRGALPPLSLYPFIAC